MSSSAAKTWDGDAPSGPIYAGTAGRRYDDLYVQFKIYYAPGFDTSGASTKEKQNEDY